MSNPVEFDVESLTVGFANSDLSPVEVAQACLDAISEINPALNAFTDFDADSALAQAKSSEFRWRLGTPLGRLDGIPVAIKDTMAMRGWQTRKGSLQTVDAAEETQDAPAVARLRDGGAVFLGKTTTPEFGWKGVGDSPLTGITRNPWDQQRTTGGSSAGSAAAVATGMTVLATGTDGGGSVRMPAAFCGIFGLKPTFSVIPVFPPSTGGTLSHVGPMTRTVADAAAMMEVVARADPREIYPVPEDSSPWVSELGRGIDGLRIAYSPDYGYADVDPQIAAAVQAATLFMQDAGATVELIDPPFEDPREDFCTIWDAMLSMALLGVATERLGKSDTGLRATFERGSKLTAQDYLNAEKARLRMSKSLAELFSSYDLLISPQMPTVALPVGQDVWDTDAQDHWTQWTPFTYPHNLSRCPAASVPIGLTDDGLPMAMQIVGRHFDDRLVLRAAARYEADNPFTRWSM